MPVKRYKETANAYQKIQCLSQKTQNIKKIIKISIIFNKNKNVTVTAWVILKPRCNNFKKQEMPRFQARNFQITINKASMDYYEEIKEYILEKEPNYFISCIEENKKEELHIHIYVQFQKVASISTKHMHGAHIEVCKGTPIENKQYIEKIKETFRINNTLDEIGTIRNNGTKSESAASIAEKTFDEVSKSEFRVWKDVAYSLTPTIEELYKPNLEVYYIWGPSGIGKSKKAKEMIGMKERADMVQYTNGFWLGVNTLRPVKICLYDEFRDSHMPVSIFLKFIDYNRQQMSIKFCPHWLNQYERIFITSIQSPHDIYSNIPEETKQQWLRRMKIIHMEKL